MIRNGFIPQYVARLMMYLTKRVRPDLSFCTNNFLSSRVQYSTVRDMRKLVKVLEYLNETRDLGLTLGAEDLSLSFDFVC